MALMGYDSEVVARVMKEKGEQTYWPTTIPFTFMFRSCISPSFMPPWAVDFTFYLVVQFAVIVPLMGLIQLWMLLDGWESSSAPSIVGIISTLVAMQGLFMLYRATYPVINHYRPTFKFATIKLIVLIAIIQSRVIEYIVQKKHSSIGTYDHVALANIWEVFLLAIESPFFALLMVKAFPLEELTKHAGEGGTAKMDWSGAGLMRPKEDVELDADGKPKPKVSTSKRSSTSVDERTGAVI